MIGRLVLTHLLLLALALSPSLRADGEVSCDTVPTLAEEIRQLRDVDARRGLERGERTLEVLRQTDPLCRSGEVLLLRAIASNLHILGDSGDALLRINEALAVLEQMPEPDPSLVAKAHLAAGVVNWELEAHDRAIRHYLEALEASEQAGDVSGVARAAGNIGNLYTTLGRFERAREYHQRALESFEKTDMATGVAGSLVNLAAVARHLGGRAEKDGDQELARREYQHMLEVGQRALERFRALDNPRGVAYAAANVASALERLGRSDEALDYQELAMDLRRDVGDTMGEIESMRSLAMTYQSLGRLEEAAALLAEAARRLPEDRVGPAIEIAEQRVALEEERGNFEKALEHHKEVDRLRRIVAENQMAARVEEVRLSMQAERQKQELELLKRQAEISDLRLERQRATSAIIGMFTVLLLVLLGALYGRYRLGVKTSRKLELASRTDPLTGLSNRRAMLDHLAKALQRCTEHGERAALIMADVDGFKEINDTHGHAAGDRALVHVGQILASRLRGRDVISRWGGEEFLMMLPQTDIEGGLSVVENLRTALSSEPPEIEGAGPFELTLTYGVTEMRPGLELDECIKQADDALYAGKAQGKDRVVAFER